MKGSIFPMELLDGRFVVGFDEVLCKELFTKVPFEARACLPVICARLLGLSYADYLRYGRDVYGGKLSGKNHYYPILSFSKKEECQKLCSDLMIRWRKVN
jgi:hypothetical protein